MLAVVVADVAVAGEWQFDRRQFGTSPGELRALAAWFLEREVGGSGDGIDRAVLATGLRDVGT